MQQFTRLITTFCLAAFFGLLASAQTWSLLGNNDATASSKLGTINSQPVRIFVKNSEKMRVDSQGTVSIGSTTPNASAILDIASTNRGILAPRMTLNQRNNIPSPATGLLIYQTNSSPGFFMFNGTTWTAVTPSRANTTLSNLTAPTAINQSLLPGTTNTLDVGSSTNQWNNLFSSNGLFSGNVGIGNTTPDASSLLDISSTSKGVLIPRLTTAQKNALATPATGLLIYQTDSVPGFYYFNSTWLNLTTSDVASNAANKTLSNLTTPTAINQSLLPGVDTSLDLGNDTMKWRNLTTSGTVKHSKLKGTGFRSLFADSLGNLVVDIPSVLSAGNNNISQSIPDNSCTGVTSSITLSGLPALANPSNIKVKINITHPDVSQLSVFFITPDSSIINLVKANSGVTTGSNFSNTLFALNGVSLVAGFQPYNGTFLPFGNRESHICGLTPTAATFNNIADSGANFNPNGNYILRVYDEVTGTTGTLNNWSLNIDIPKEGIWGLIGNKGTTSSNFIGTTDNQSLRFKVNNQPAGLIGNEGNVALGLNSLTNNISGLNLTAIGHLALTSNTTGSLNTALGDRAMRTNTTGSSNVAVGFQSLSNNTSGLENTAAGLSSLLSNTTGTANTAVGLFALTNNTTGNLNTAIGRSAALGNTTGSLNTSIGTRALFTNTTGSNLVAIGDSALFFQNGGNGQNTAVGSKALFANTTGSSNTAIGFNSLKSNTIGLQNTAIGMSAMQSNTTGFANTANGYQALNNNTIGSSNTANGTGALNKNTTGNFNTANGVSALFLNTTGSSNTANGKDALFSNTTGSSNTANGESALFSNTTGSFNTANGVYALNGNTAGNFNTATGREALLSNTTGSGNTAYGVNAMTNNSTGFSNTSIGLDALRANNTGNKNTAIGDSAARANTTGINNTVVGFRSLLNNTSGSNNVAVGDSALRSISTGSNNTALGHNTIFNSGATNNSTALGANTAVTSLNQIRLGNSAVTSIGGQVGFTALSDGRFKTNVQTNVPGIDFINKLHPVTYHFNVKKIDEFNGFNPYTAEQLKARDEKEAITYTGFIAQDVEKAAKEMNYNFSGVDAPKNDKDMYGLRYAEFVVPLVKAVQELSSQNEKLKMKNEELVKNDTNLQKQIDELKEAMIKLINQQKCVSTTNR